MSNDELSDFDKKSIQDAWIAAETRHRENEYTFIKYVFTFSSAFLGFSIALVTSISGKTDVNINKALLISCWITIVLTMMIGLLSLLISKKANVRYMENLQRRLNRESEYPNGYDKACVILEWILFVLLCISIVFNLLFIHSYI